MPAAMHGVGSRPNPTTSRQSEHDILIAFEDAVAEFVAAQVSADVLDGIEFGALMFAVNS
jgi:hypothetical protein